MDLAERFHDQHEADRGFAFRNQEPTVRGVRTTAVGRVTKPPILAEVGDCADAAAPGPAPGRCRSATGSSRRRVRRFPARPGAESSGPALVEEPFTVVVVPPGGPLRLDEHTSYELSLGG